jgi:hypothetical protein
MKPVANYGPDSGLYQLAVCKITGKIISFADAERSAITVGLFGSEIPNPHHCRQYEPKLDIYNV